MLSPRIPIDLSRPNGFCVSEGRLENTGTHQNVGGKTGLVIGDQREGGLSHHCLVTGPSLILLSLVNISDWS